MKLTELLMADIKGDPKQCFDDMTLEQMKDVMFPKVNLQQLQGNHLEPDVAEQLQKVINMDQNYYNKIMAKPMAFIIRHLESPTS